MNGFGFGFGFGFEFEFDCLSWSKRDDKRRMCSSREKEKTAEWMDDYGIYCTSAAVMNARFMGGVSLML